MPRQLIVELDDSLSRELERVAPARSRRRSAFVRTALRRALDDLAEAQMAEAYKAQPDAEPAHFDPRVWEPGTAVRATKRRRPSTRKRR
jgi:predicted transcriptional regulator